MLCRLTTNKIDWLTVSIVLCFQMQEAETRLKSADVKFLSVVLYKAMLGLMNNVEITTVRSDLLTHCIVNRQNLA